MSTPLVDLGAEHVGEATEVTDALTGGLLCETLGFGAHDGKAEVTRGSTDRGERGLSRGSSTNLWEAATSMSARQKNAIRGVLRRERCRCIPVASWSAVARIASASAVSVCLLLDVQPAVADWDVPLQNLVDHLRVVSEELLKLPNGREITFLTNAALGLERSYSIPGCKLRERAHKPFTNWKKPEDSVQVIVVGDQVLTDGLLAWRLSADFLYWIASSNVEPLWPHLQRKLGALLLRALFVRE